MAGLEPQRTGCINGQYGPAGPTGLSAGGLAGCVPIGLVPKRRTAFTFDAPQGLDLAPLPMMIDFDESFYFKPEVGQFLGSLADETPSAPCDAQPEEIDVATAVERIETASDRLLAQGRAELAARGMDPLASS